MTSPDQHASLQAKQETTPEGDWGNRYIKAIGRGQRRDYDPKSRIVIKRGSGALLWDVNDRCFVDLTCGYSATNFGHGFPPVVSQVAKQLVTLSHLTGQPHVLQIQLAERLSSLLTSFIESTENTPEPAKLLFCTSGARAVEVAWQAAIAHRPGKLLCLAPGFHGNTVALHHMSHTTIQWASNPNNQDTQQHQSVIWPAQHYPYCDRCPFGLQPQSCKLDCSQGLFDFLASNHHHISAILVEPALGARGYIFPPNGFFQQLRSLTAKLGILMIADEVQTGLGRCGAWLLAERQGWKPDLAVLG